MSASWRVLGREEGLGDQVLPALAEGRQGRATGARDGSGAPWGRENLGALRGYPVLHKCGTGFHETDGDG